MKVIRLSLLGCLLAGIAALGCTGLKKPATSESENTAANKDKLIAVWEAVKTGDGKGEMVGFGKNTKIKPGDRVQFAAEEKLKVGFFDAKTKKWTVYNGTFKVQEAKVTTTLKGLEVKDTKHDLTIEAVTDDKLVLKDDKGKTEFKKMQADSTDTNKEQVVGTWEVAKSNILDRNSIVEFTKDGKLKISSPDGTGGMKSRETTYEVAGDKIKTGLTHPDKKPVTLTIKSVTSTALNTVDDNGQPTEFKKQGIALLPAPATLAEDFKGLIGGKAAFVVTGTTEGNVWGTDLYTLDSVLAAAAVHAGVVKPNETAIVQIEILQPPPKFTGSARNGVTSADWEAYPDGAFKFVKVGGLTDPGSLFQLFAGKFGLRASFIVTGTTDGNLWGTDIYTLDSTLAVAAVHAGLLKPGQTGTIQVEIVQPPPNFTGSARNGVTSASWDAFPDGAFKVSKPGK